MQLWSHGGQLLRHVAGHELTVHDLAFDVEERLLVSASKDGTARVWDVASAQCLFVHDFDAGYVFSVTLSCSNLMAVSLRDANQIRFVQLGRAALVKQLAVDWPGKVRFAPSQCGKPQDVYLSTYDAWLCCFQVQ